MDILELLRFPCPVVDICHAYTGLGLVMGKELYLKLTLAMAEKRKTEPQPDKEPSGRGLISISNLGQSVIQTQSLAVSCPIGHSTGWA